MSKYTVEHSCGHSEDHQIYGKVSERDGKAEWLAGRLCGDCYRAAKRADETAKAAEASVGLPALTGSDKQVAWATKIRARIIAKTREKVEDLIIRQLARKPKATAQMRAVLDQVGVKHADARYWIDNDNTESLIDDVVKEFNAISAAAKAANPTD